MRRCLVMRLVSRAPGLRLPLIFPPEDQRETVFTINTEQRAPGPSWAGGQGQFPVVVRRRCPGSVRFEKFSEETLRHI